jgi:hypothetical protein
VEQEPSGEWRNTLVEHLAGRASSHPAAVRGPRLAADVVAMAREWAGIRLDYTPHSLALLDRIVDSIRQQRPSAPPVTRTLVAFGAYTGQVLVCEAGAVWVDFDPGERDIFGQPFGIRTPDGRLWNPLGKAVKRYCNGPEDSLRLFYLSVVGQAQL